MPRHDIAAVEIPYLELITNQRVFCPQLEKIERHLFVGPYAVFDAPELKEVGGGVMIYPDAQVHVPKLAGIYGLVLFEGTSLDAPALLTIGNLLTVRDRATLNAPLLRVVNGELYIRDGARFGHGRPTQGERDDQEGFRRRHRTRMRASLSTEPHSRCERAGYCTEHEADPDVDACR